MRLETFYNIKAIPLIRSFVSEAAFFYGANNRERYALELAAEEAANHIISNFPGQFSDTFEILIKVDKSSKILKVEMANKGLPVNEKNIPEYSVDKLEESIDGLRFHLIKKLVDAFHFENLGRGGWKTIIEKRIEDFSDPLEKHISLQIDKNIDPKQVRFRLAEPEDAYEITKLAYLTYRYSYGRSTFYYPEVLKESIANGDVISFVAEAENGEIVAHTGYIKSKNGEGIFESMALMARVEVRKTPVVPGLLKFQYDYSMKHSDRIKVVEVELVTGHISSQKISHFYGFSPFALFVSYYDQNEFVGIDVPEERQRETILYALRPSGNPLNGKLFAPPAHENFLKELFSDRMYNIQIMTQENGKAKCDTLLSVTKRKDMSLGVIRIKRIGENWFEELKKTAMQIKFEGYKTMYARIEANSPLPNKLDEKLNLLGFFFSGCVIGPIDTWSLLYVQPVNQKIDWDKIKLYDERAVKLKKYAQENYQRVYEISQ